MADVGDTDEDGLSPFMRTVVIAFGGICFALGIFGSFKTKNGLGFTTLIIVGAGAFLISAIGRWPDNFNLSQGSFGYSKPSERTIAEKSAEGVIESAASYRVENLQTIQPESLTNTEISTGYSYTEYDLQLQKSLRQKFPKSRLTRETRVGDMRADFELVANEVSLFIETKFLKSPDSKFKGVTLDPLLRGFPRGERLLVIANVEDVETARKKVRDALGPDRADVIAWRGPEDNRPLWLAIERLTALN